MPFHPSPNESYMFRVHVAPFVIVCEEAYGAPPLSDVPSLHERVHDTSFINEPPPTEMVDVLVADVLAVNVTL